MLTDEILQVVNDDLRVVGGVHGALQERRPRAELSLLQQFTAYLFDYYIKIYKKLWSHSYSHIAHLHDWINSVMK